MGKADSFLTGAQRRNLGVDDVVPDGRFAGKTVREIYGMLQQQEQGYSGLQQSANSGEMTIEEAMQGGFNSPDPRSYRVPYGPFQGMSMDQLAQRYKEQQSYLQDNGFVAKEPEEPGMVDQIMPLATGIGSAVTAGALTNYLSGQTALNAAQTAAQTAAPSAVPGAVTAGAAPAVPTVIGGAPIASTVPAAAHSYGMLGLNAAPGTVGGAFLPAAGVAAGAYTGMQQGKGLLNAVKGKDMSFQEEAALALPTFGLSFAVDPVKKLFGGGRHEGVSQRETNRNAFRDDSQIYAGNDIGLAGGNTFNIGSNRNTETTDIDWDKAKGTPGDEDLISRLDSLTVALSPLTGDQRAWQTGEFYNAATSSGDSMANVQQMFKNSGRTYEEIRQGIREATDISEQERQVHLANVDVVEQYGGPTPAAVLPGQQAKAATLPAPTTASVDRNAGRPAPVFNDPLAVNLAPKAAPGQKKGSTRLKAFWGQ